MNQTPRQQINLYQDMFRRQQEPLDSGVLLRGAGVLAVLLLLYSTLNLWNFFSASQDREKLLARQAELAEELAQVKQTFPPRALDTDLQRRVARLTQRVAAKRRVIDALTDRNFGNAQGFAEHLAALSRQRLDGLWLTGLAIAGGGEQMEVRGATLEPELVPRLIQRLSVEKVFLGTEFRRFLMQRDEENPGQILFDLSTQGDYTVPAEGAS
ncbi:MAG TPA: hypothetical protein ENJ01_12415 [Gammaproteobacteria bacterium]|nr:hypothetical protein [Gammaproteobacteria bacterium]